MLNLSELTLDEFHGFFSECGQHGKGAGKPALTKFAVTDRAEHRLPVYPIADRPANTSSRVNFVHPGIRRPLTMNWCAAPSPQYRFSLSPHRPVLSTDFHRSV